MKAFQQIIEFFDNVPDINLPEDLQQYLDEYLEVYSSEEGTKIISDIFQKKIMRCKILMSLWRIIKNS